nr:DNA replication licensing factor MCM6 [Tanacetum cinerariifolium]
MQQETSKSIDPGKKVVQNKPFMTLTMENNVPPPCTSFEETGFPSELLKEKTHRVTQTLVMRLRQHEETVTREGIARMRQRVLIQWYASQQNEKNNYNSIEEAKAEVIKTKAIIDSLIRREGHLIVVDEDEAPSQGDDDGIGNRTSRNNMILANYVIYYEFKSVVTPVRMS